MNKLLKNAVLMIPAVKRYYQHAKELSNQLESLRSQNEQMRLNYEAQLGRTHYQLRELNSIFEDNVKLSWSDNNERKQWICMNPFNRISISGDGRVWTCCPNYLKHDYFLGNAYVNTFEEIWNSDIAKKLRFSVSCGNFEYCNKTFCSRLRDPLLCSDSMLPRTEGIGTLQHKKWQDYSLETTPLYINLACDSSCNLHCVSCRNHIKIDSNEKNKKISLMLEDFVRPALQNCIDLTSSTSGEFFASKPLLLFYQTLSKEQYPLLKLNFMTNGTLFTPERWEKLSNLKGMVGRIQVSIDAASKETYETLRRGGKWESLCNNMEYISSLRVSNEIKPFVMSFVVQKENFRQMNDYVALAKQWHADSVSFRRLYNPGGTYTAESLVENDVFSTINPHYGEAVKILTELKRESGIRIMDNCMPSGQIDEDL